MFDAARTAHRQRSRVAGYSCKLHGILLPLGQRLGKFTPELKAQLTSGQGIPRELRWQPRQRTACVFCARSHWLEELHDVFLAGEQCFMREPHRVWDLLSVKR